MIPTRRRNRWSPYYWVLFILWAAGFVVARATGIEAFGWVSLALTVMLVLIWSLERRYEAESDRIVAMAVFGRDQEAAWERGYTSGYSRGYNQAEDDQRS